MSAVDPESGEMEPVRPGEGAVESPEGEPRAPTNPPAGP